MAMGLYRKDSPYSVDSTSKRTGAPDQAICPVIIRYGTAGVEIRKLSKYT